MTKKEIVWKILNMSDSRRSVVISKAVESYFYILLAIVNDIYDSCIEDFYSGYVPKFYNRHGNIEGFNLYNANANSISPDGHLQIITDSSKLLPYKSGDAASVLGSVENGKRGGPGIKAKGWPKKWYTSYPNSYSEYHIWYSSGYTIETIMEDFEKNGISQTKDILWKCIEKCI